MSNSQIYLKSGFPRAPLGNGIGRYIGQLQRVTLKFCKNHGASRGVRDFIENDLLNYAKENPGVVVYCKPRRHRGPVIKAEYLNGETHWIPCQKFSREDVVKYMELVRTQSYNGSSLRLRKFWHTEFPSIQGPWTPFTNRDPKLNITEFPNKEIGACTKYGPSATEEIIRLFKEQQLQEKLKEEGEIEEH
ncbi:39S ribosomal protein L43, mitochondrial [Nasonia vitripennis]|uniref:Large ribosomal subunit protein mL43 n=1 Tax=Nasonia vitripennis TaxID=7425 RepID=A0A7M7TE13_NASVI|nr:39S ribosomal protein L43, mitochondrial [Nasonia vitripennis]XP_031787979.1 39S ribosomal protein L43, mitochondrial [Nasonia vitripennis]XP_032456653.1 39S ribosomal protein L43, mitochondrial [Nasonia vitripennis]